MKNGMKNFMCMFLLFGVLCVLANSCKKSDTTLSVGLTYQGGIISYIFQPGESGYVEGETHGYILAPYDQGKYQWGCGGSDWPGGIIIGTSCDDHTGAQNTDLIVANCPEVTAASICKNLVLNGYDDWYLPTNTELIYAYNNLYIKGLGNFASTDTFYWSCQEFCGDGYKNTHALGYVFGSSYQDNSWKIYALAVRAARTF